MGERSGGEKEEPAESALISMSNIVFMGHAGSYSSSRAEVGSPPQSRGFGPNPLARARCARLSLAPGNSARPGLRWAVLRRTIALALLFPLALTSCTKQARKQRALHRAADYFASGKFDSARVEYLNALRLDPVDPVPYRKLGAIWLDEGAPLRAVPYLLKARDLSPDDSENRKLLARGLLAMGRRGDAFEEAMKVLEKTPNDGEVARTAAEAARNDDELARAERALAAIQPQDAAAVQLALATAATRRGNREGARKAVENALTADPRSSLAHLFMATLALVDNDSSKARDEFKAAAELAGPRSIERIRYAQFQLNAGDKDAAVATLRGITGVAPDYLPAWILLAEISLGKKEYDETLKLLANVLNRDPENIEANIAQARTWSAKGDPDKAIQGLERLDAKFQNFAPLKYELARCYAQKNNSGQAIDLLNQAIAASPDYVDAVLLRAQLQLRAGKAKEVVEQLRPILDKHPELGTVRIVLADAYRIVGRLDDAAALFREQLKSSPNNVEACIALGIILRQQHKTAEAREMLMRARQLAPGNPLALVQLVDLQLADRNFKAAHQLVQDQLHSTPDSALAHFLEGKVFAGEQKWGPAEDSLKRAVTSNPNFGEAYSLLATVYAASNKLADAARQLEIVAERSPNNTQVLMSLAVLYEKMGEPDKARDRYEKLLGLIPDFAPALNNLAYLYADQLHQLDRAYQLAQKARSLQPGDASIADTLGWILYKKRDYKQAIALFNEAVAKTPNDPEIQYHLGMCHYMIGETDAAEAAFQQALKLPGEFRNKTDAQRRLSLVSKTDPKVNLTVADLESTIRTEPDDLLARMGLAEKYESAGRFRDAANQYEEIVKLNPRFRVAFVRLAELYSGPVKDPDRALSYAKAARDLSQDDPRATLLLGRVALSAGNYSWAYSLLKQGCDQLPGDAAGQYDLGLAAFALGKTSEAATQMQRVVQTAGAAGENARTWLALMQLENDGAQTPAAAEQVANALKKDPNYAPAQLAQAATLAKRGESDKAAALYEQVLNRYPDYVPAQKRLATIYAARSSDLAKAYDLASKAHKSLPDDVELDRLLAEISYQRKDYGRALQYLEEAAGKQPLDARLLYLKGVCSLQVNDVAQGREALTHALADGLQDPFATEARRTLESLKK